MEWAFAAFVRVRVAWAVAAAAYRVTVLRNFLETADFLVHKVIAFDDETDTHQKVTASFDPRAWEVTVREQTRWTTDNLRVDVRYLSRGKKFRMVLRPGDECSFAALSKSCSPDGVLSAELVQTDDKRSFNVTARVLKYQGPGKDFQAGMRHRVGVYDMFPQDDPEELAATYSGVRVMHLVDGSVRTVLVPMECDDVFAALRAGE